MLSTPLTPAQPSSFFDPTQVTAVRPGGCSPSGSHLGKQEGASMWATRGGGGGQLGQRVWEVRLGHGAAIVLLAGAVSRF